ncbi:MAG: amidase domain-containing protein [Clostridia bacterium]|nr:amidase domain-containing protein [Clostridia bacterium]
MNKKKKKLKKSAKIIIIILIVAILAGLGYLFYENYQEQKRIEAERAAYEARQAEIAQSHLGKFSNKFSLDKGAKKRLIAFTDDLYRCQMEIPRLYNKNFKYNQEKIDRILPDLSKHFATGSYTEKAVCRTALRFSLTARALAPFDTSLEKCSYDIKIRNVSGDENGLKIDYYESAKINFRFIPDINSQMYHIKNSIVLKKQDGKWKVSKYYREEDFYLAVINDYDYSAHTKDSIDKSLDQVFSKLMKKNIGNTKSYIKDMQAFNSGEFVDKPKSCDVAYDRESALKYAKKYVKKRNTKAGWAVFDDWGGNCQNFGSQMLNAGGIPMDLEGSQVWKYYGTTNDNSNSAYGYSASWAVAPSFRYYAQNNKGYGLVAKVDVNKFAAEAGDILQVGTGKDGISHTNVVVGTVKDSKDRTIDVLVNSNTNNRINWPMWMGLSKYQSLVKIYGWNK